MTKIEVLDTDITTLEVDAIANAANTRLIHGGGVAGAIARAGGPDLQAESAARQNADNAIGALIAAESTQRQQADDSCAASSLSVAVHDAR